MPQAAFSSNNIKLVFDVSTGSVKTRSRVLSPSHGLYLVFAFQRQDSNYRVAHAGILTERL